MKYILRVIRKHLFLILFVIFSLHLGFRIFSYLPEYSIPFDPEYWEERYNASQWVVPDSKNTIGDDGLYAHVGWKYINGADPTLLNAEIPPLGKYIIGAGELLFQNQNILMLIVGLLCLGVLYLLNLSIFKNKLFAFIPVFLFSFDELFYSQLRAPYLDTIYLLFLLLSLLFAVRRSYILSSIFLGCFAATKFPAGSLFLAAALFAWVVLYHRKDTFKFLLSLIFWPLVFILSYSAFFIWGGSIFSFLGVQKWIISFYGSGAQASPGIVYPMLFNGTWFTWFGGAQVVAEWNTFWPVSGIISLIALFTLGRLYLHKNTREKYDKVSLIALWVLSYLVFLTVTPVFPRYLLLLLPFMYNLTVWFLEKYLLPRF